MRVSIDRARWPATDGQPEPCAPDERLDFVRFCYRRRRVAWPELYDEMAAVAARSAYNGLGFAELAERGICFTLGELPSLVALASQVIAEEHVEEQVIDEEDDRPVPTFVLAPAPA